MKKIKKREKSKSFKYLMIILAIVFLLSLVSLFAGDYLAANFDVIGIRIAVLIVSFAAFGASTYFSLVVHLNNKTMSKLNDDQNKRAEQFRTLQFVSNNYSIIEFNDRMLIMKESSWYVKKFFQKEIPSFHMAQKNIDIDKELEFYTIRIPFRVLEGRTPGSIMLSKITFEKGSQRFDFYPLEHEEITQSYILYNEKTQRNNLIMNLVFNKESHYFEENEINQFSKIRIAFAITSILGVTLQGVSELYFTNPVQVEGDGLHTYKINSSNFKLTANPYIEKKNIED